MKINQQWFSIYLEKLHAHRFYGTSSILVVNFLLTVSADVSEYPGLVCWFLRFSWKSWMQFLSLKRGSSFISFEFFFLKWVCTQRFRVSNDLSLGTNVTKLLGWFVWHSPLLISCSPCLYRMPFSCLSCLIGVLCFVSADVLVTSIGPIPDLNRVKIPFSMTISILLDTLKCSSSAPSVCLSVSPLSLFQPDLAKSVLFSANWY